MASDRDGWTGKCFRLDFGGMSADISGYSHHTSPLPEGEGAVAPKFEVRKVYVKRRRTNLYWDDGISLNTNSAF